MKTILDLVRSREVDLPQDTDVTQNEEDLPSQPPATGYPESYLHSRNIFLRKAAETYNIRFSTKARREARVELPMHQYRQQVLDSLQRAAKQPPDAVRWLGHLAGSGHAWLSRVRQSESPLAIWPELTVEHSAAHLERLGDGWIAFLDGIASDALGESVVYRNSRGEEFSTVLADILTHVSLHGAYHRGQIAASMRASGETPAPSDYIIAVREGLLE